MAVIALVFLVKTLTFGSGFILLFFWSDAKNRKADCH